MDLIAVISNKEEGKLTELYIDRGNVLTGFTFDGESVGQLQIDEIKSVFGLFLLGNNRKPIGKNEGFDMILDEDTGLIHYFEKGVENLHMLFEKNGEDVTRADIFSKDNLGLKAAREYIFKRTAVTISVICLSATLMPHMLHSMFKDLSFVMQGERVNAFDYVDYVIENRDFGEANEALSVDDIENYIRQSAGINNEEVKNFLCNRELLEKAIPLYEGNYLNFITRLRHDGLTVDNRSFGRFYSGNYLFGHTLYVDGFNEDEFEPSSDKAKTLGHEYVHLLQSYSVFHFICEISAELIAREYFMNTSTIRGNYSYSDECRRLCVMMEIIGSESIWENNFDANSSLFEDSIRPYLSEEEFDEFIDLMNFDPGKNLGQFIIYKKRFDELLDILHRNKFGFSMYDNFKIRSILESDGFDRVYFSDSLKEKKRDYFVVNVLNLSHLSSDIISIKGSDERELRLEECKNEVEFASKCTVLFDCKIDAENNIVFNSPVEVHVRSLEKSINEIKMIHG